MFSFFLKSGDGAGDARASREAWGKKNKLFKVTNLMEGRSCCGQFLAAKGNFFLNVTNLMEGRSLMGRDAAELESRRRSIALEVATLAALPPPIAFGWSVGQVG